MKWPEKFIRDIEMDQKRFIGGVLTIFPKNVSPGETGQMFVRANLPDPCMLNLAEEIHVWVTFILT